MTNLSIIDTIDSEIVESEIVEPSTLREPLEEYCCFNDDYEIVTDWLLGKSKHSKKLYYESLNQLSIFLTGEKFGMLNKDILSQISKKDIQSFLYYCRKKGNKPSTIKTKLSALNSLFQHLVSENYRKVNPARNIKLEQEDKEDKSKQKLDVKQKTIKQEDIKKIVHNALNDRDAVLFELLYSLGLRMHEALNLSWSDFYFYNDKVYVSILGKGNKTRQNQLPIALYQKLRNLNTSDYLFLSNRGKKLSLRACDKNFKLACDRAGLSTEYSCHWLRHSHATHALESGKSLVAVRDQLGHSSLAITSEYLHNEESTSLELKL
jgi:integrase/recombinase XerD